MKTGVSAKAGLAFLAGVVLALGGAFTYLKVTDPPHAPTQIQSATVDTPPMAAGGSAVNSAPEPAAAATPAPAPTAPANPTPVAVEQPRVVRPKLALTKPKVTSRPVSLAVAQRPRQSQYSAPSPNQYPAPYTSPEHQYASPDGAAAPTPSSAAPTDLPVPPPALVAVTRAETAPAAPQPHTVTLPAGTHVAVRLSEKLSTEHSYSGDTFRASLDAPLTMDGFIIADKGARVLGRVVKADKAGKMQGASELSLTLTEIATTDGQRMHVETNDSLRKGPSNVAQSVEKMGGGAALGAIIGAIAGGGKGAAIGAGAGGAAGTGAVFLGHGKPVVMDVETPLNFQLTSPTTLTEKLN